MTNDHNATTASFSSADTKRGAWRSVSRVLGYACVLIWFILPLWTLHFILDERAFLQRARASAWGEVTQVSETVSYNSYGTYGTTAILCHETITFQPVGGRPLSFTSEGAAQLFLTTDETCGDPGGMVLVLYDPHHPSDGRVAEVVQNDLVIQMIQEGLLSLFEVVFLVTCLRPLVFHLPTWWKKSGDS